MTGDPNQEQPDMFPNVETNGFRSIGKMTMSTIDDVIKLGHLLGGHGVDDHLDWIISEGLNMIDHLRVLGGYKPLQTPLVCEVINSLMEFTIHARAAMMDLVVKCCFSESPRVLNKDDSEWHTVDCIKLELEDIGETLEEVFYFAQVGMEKTPEGSWTVNRGVLATANAMYEYMHNGDIHLFKLVKGRMWDGDVEDIALRPLEVAEFNLHPGEADCIEKWCQSTAPIEGALEGPERDEVVWPTDTDLFDDEEYFADEE